MSDSIGASRPFSLCRVWMCTLSTGWSLVSTSYKTTTTTLLRPFNGLFSRTTWVSRYQKDKTSLDLNEARDYTFFEDGNGISWTIIMQNNLHLKLLQTDNHINTSLLNFYRPDALSDAQPTVSKHWRPGASTPYKRWSKCTMKKIGGKVFAGT